MTNYPKISIVTPSFNHGRFIEKTIRSVIEQDYPNLEYIIIDGGSTDESVEIIKKYEQHLTYWVSEPDRGQSHAINKGFEKATGEIYGWLNSDDWYHPGALKAVAEAFAANPDAGAVVGAGDMYSEEHDCRETIEPLPIVTVESLYGAVDRFFMQPSCFFTHTAWKECGPLDESLHLAMDLDLWFKIAKKYRYAVIDTNLSTSLIHQSAKTTALAPESLVDASLVIMRHGGEREGRQRLVDFVWELYDTRRVLSRLQSEHSHLQSEHFHLQSEHFHLKSEHFHLQSEHSRLLRAFHHKDVEIQALKNSLSWRVTVPLRWLGGLMGYNVQRVEAVGHGPEAECQETSKKATLDDMAALLASHPGTQQPVLLLDFNLGGGSMLYSRSLITQMERQGQRVVLLEYCYWQKQYHVSCRTGDRITDVFLPPDLNGFLPYLLHKLETRLILVSQLVSWPDTGVVLAAIRDCGVPYRVLVHDYFMVCPNYTLFDYRYRYCGVPDDPTACAICLENLRALDIPLKHHTGRKRIEPWRRDALSFLAGAERVICFSEASKRIMQRAYPILDNLVVNEHCIPDRYLFGWQQRSVPEDGSVTIAVVGEIALHKGSALIEQLSADPRFSEGALRLVVIGTMTTPVSSDQVVVHGQYERKDLGALLEHYRASAVLLPSLWPETFCFTASEAMLLGYPVIACNIGAQADRVRRYDAGWVVDEPYVNGILAVISEILAQPHIVVEKSLNARAYEPPSEERHLAGICRDMEG